jgi:solute carrier family 12 sodium/potassium/chloride transporter 2
MDQNSRDEETPVDEDPAVTEAEQATPEDNLDPEKLDEAEQKEPQQFGTFGGVFVPTLLTILGVILFLRQGWVVGNAGLLGSLLIVTLAFLIVGFTALSMSSMTTNIRIGAGGAYSIISQSLGLEIGGSVGVPLYLAQALAVTMYIFGFREGVMWGWEQYAELPLSLPLMQLAVDLSTFAVLFGIIFISTSLAFRIQYVILVLIIGSLVSIFGVVLVPDTLVEPITWWGDFQGDVSEATPGLGFWGVFAVFFPAATGIMAGANMSGDLKDPRRSIPLGTLSAIGVSYIIYIGVAVLLAKVASPTELLSNYTILIDIALWEPAVLAGLLGATFSSALASFVGAPRILQALGDHRILPGSSWFSDLSRAGEPRNAMLLTGIIVLGALMLRDLNAIAPLITMFFMITYTMINFVVLVEQSLDMVGFRPTFRVPIYVPLIGTAGCLFAMFIINATFGLVAIAIVAGIYVYLLQKHLIAPHGDIRSGLFMALGEWIAKHVMELPQSEQRAWKPNLLVPIEQGRELRGSFEFLRNLTYPKGSLKLVGIKQRDETTDLADELKHLADGFRDEGVFTQYITMDSPDFQQGIFSSMQVLSGAFFSPNIIFLTLPQLEKRRDDFQQLVKRSRDYNMALQIYAPDPVAQLGRRSDVNVWMRDISPDWAPDNIPDNTHLSLLSGYKLQVNWKANLRVICGVEDSKQVEEAERFLSNLLDQARLTKTELHVINGDFEETIKQAPSADLDIFGIGESADFDFMNEMVERTESACLFVKDSGRENILA